MGKTYPQLSHTHPHVQAPSLIPFIKDYLDLQIPLLNVHTVQRILPSSSTTQLNQNLRGLPEHPEQEQRRESSVEDVGRFSEACHFFANVRRISLLSPC